MAEIKTHTILLGGDALLPAKNGLLDIAPGGLLKIDGKLYKVEKELTETKESDGARYAMQSVHVTPVSRIQACNIQWDAPDDVAESLPEQIDIPLETIIECDGDGMPDYIDKISDYITGQSGFCHNGFALDCE